METTSKKFVLRATVEELQVYGNIRDLNPAKLIAVYNQVRVKPNHEVSIDFDMKSGDNIFKLRRCYAPSWAAEEDMTQVEVQYAVWRWFCDYQGSKQDKVTVFHDGVYWQYFPPQKAVKLR